MQQYNNRGMLQHKCITHTVPQTTLQRAHIHKTKCCFSPSYTQAPNSGNEFCATQLISHLPSTGRGKTRLLESPYSHRVEQGQVFCSFDRQLFCSVVVDDFRNTVEWRAVLTQDVFFFGFRQLHMHKTLTAPARKAKCKFMLVHRQEGCSTTTGPPHGGESRTKCQYLLGGRPRQWSDCFQLLLATSMDSSPQTQSKAVFSFQHLHCLDPHAWLSHTESDPEVYQ